MNREIKFRAWVKGDERMACSDEIVVWNNNVYINESKILDSKIKGFSNLNRYFMQYTGIKDKNGVDIYEGDILKFSNIFNEQGYFKKDFVIFECGAFQCNYSLISNYTTSTIEVIGNIYENPELLEDENNEI